MKPLVAAARVGRRVSIARSPRTSRALGLALAVFFCLSVARNLHVHGSRDVLAFACPLQAFEFVHRLVHLALDRGVVTEYPIQIGTLGLAQMLVDALHTHKFRENAPLFIRDHVHREVERLSSHNCGFAAMNALSVGNSKLQSAPREGFPERQLAQTPNERPLRFLRILSSHRQHRSQKSGARKLGFRA